MKKLILFLGIATLISCTCLPQIPPQYLPANRSCEAYLPNYLVYITVLNNCGDPTPTQNPLPGTILDATNPEVEVTLTATNEFGNTDIEQFYVYLWDAPEIIWDSIPADTIPPVAHLDDIDQLIERREAQIAHLATKGTVPERDSITWRQMTIHYPPK